MQKMDGKSMDLTKENIEALKKLFPEVVTEGKIDFEKLKVILGENIEKSNERYEFTWNGKTAAMKLAQTPSMGTLRPDRESSKNWDSTDNLYIEGDNLEVLKLLQKSYFGKIKMIYIDPPYNTGNDFVYKDDFRDNIKNYKEITKQTTKANPETSGRYHTDWLNMMYPRLKLARNLLTEDGVIFISIDDNEVANLKKICDEIFGEENFIANIIWERSFSPVNLKKHFSINHDYIICYSKNIDLTICNGLKRTDEADNRYRNPDNDSRGPWMSDNLTVGPAIPEKVYEITTPSGRKVLPPNGYCWRLTKERFEEFLADNRIWFGEDGNNVPRIKRFLSEVKEGITPMTIWKYTDVGHSQEAKQKLKDLFDGKAYFDYPKSIELIKRLLVLYSNSDSLILDFFSGSATTAHAVMQLNAEDGGNRKFIMVQLPEPTPENSEAYKAGYKNICEIGKERIRRAGEKIKAETGKEDLDIGFKVFKLDESNIKTWDPDYDNLKATLEDMANNIKEGRTKEDVLFEIILKLGLELNVPIDEIKVNDKVIYNVGKGALIVCLEDDITEDILNEIPKHKSEFMETRVVFKDNAFKKDADKLNAVQNLKQHGILDVRSV
ncbi:site-specific DNA-methyltransferase [Fonticella tunisiensis]|uniref:Adenine-specific DNA-methyltransferase n=1 Tax=Fonticella tunisiensis TaxID=1096341 RepID=A0A4R7KTD2_9CLOT|nr:site-specific DNA-methyltransferase [Fonticella tunisiensis]TDT63347.1 adenine-specific DNA-methyltransferase [Fonticella tunisiensis]